MGTALYDDFSFHICPPVKFLIPLGASCMDVNMGFFFAERRVLPGVIVLSSVSKLKWVE